MPPLLEICCYSIESALVAQEAGADRIELCSSLKEGGLTPSYGMLIRARTLHIPVYPIVRPRGGDFNYDEQDMAVMLTDIAFIRQQGFKGVVFGVLDSEGNVDVPKMRKLVEAAEGLDITFHRAFDVCCSQRLAIETLSKLGIKRILTSGGEATATMGLSRLKELEKNAQEHGMHLMPGAGITPENAHQFLTFTAIHTSASMTISSSMMYRNERVCMGASGDKYVLHKVDAHKVEAIKRILNGHF